MIPFDNRELAILIWILLGLGAAGISKRIRPSLVQVARAFVQPKLLVVWIAMLVYIGLELWLLAFLQVWTADLLGESIFWLLGPGIILFSRFDKAATDPKFLRRALFSILELTILFEFLINLYPLGLVAELLLVPILVVLGLTAVVTALKPEYGPARKLLDGILALAGLALLTYALVRVVRDPGGFATIGNLREFVLPILLTLGFVPFVYGVAVMTTYGTMFNRLDWKLDDNKPLARYAKWRLVRATRGRLKSLRRFSLYPWRLTSSMDRAAVSRVVDRFKSGDTGPGR
jgi:hypothetical protein